MNWARWHRWFSLVATFIAFVDSVLTWLHDWGSDE